MKHKRLLSLVASIFVSLTQTAHAVIDPEPNTIGIYFDQNADVGETSAQPNVPFPAYAILTNPTENEIWGFEFGYEIVPTGNESSFFRLSTELPPQSIDLGDSSEILNGDHVVGMASPLPSAPAVILVEWRYLLVAQMKVSLKTKASNIPSLPEGVPAYESGGTIIPLRIGGACYDGLALINEFCPLASETQSFGNIKALYR